MTTRTAVCDAARIARTKAAGRRWSSNTELPVESGLRRLAESQGCDALPDRTRGARGVGLPGAPARMTTWWGQRNGKNTPNGGSASSPTELTPSTRSRSSRWWSATSRVRGGCSTWGVVRGSWPAGPPRWERPWWASTRPAPRSPWPGNAPAGPATPRPRPIGCPCAGTSFDAVVMCLVIEHLDPFEPAIEEMARVLAPGGRCLLLINHPLLQTPGSGWVDDHILEEQYWRVGPYLRRRLDDRGGGARRQLPFMHRPLSRYVHVMGEVGLLIEDMDEPPPRPASWPRRGSTARRRRFPA